MNLKDRLKAKQQPKTNNGGSKLNMTLRNKFKKRDSNVLERTYEEKDKRSKGGLVGKRIFNTELLEKYGIKEFVTDERDVFVEVMPLSFDPNVPYVLEIPVHYKVGINDDAFICMNRYANQRCYRCEIQAPMWREPEKYTKEETKELYPTDRSCYLLWERTKELVEGESPDYSLTIWASPKTKVHSEIQAKVRNKITRTNLDISDLSLNGDGRTVSFTIVKPKNQFPDYKAFELIARDKPIPDEILELLDTIITDAEEKGYNNCIEMFLNLPTYEEVKESMETESDAPDPETNTTSSDSDNGNGNKKTFTNKFAKKTKEPDPEPEINEDEIMAKLEEVQAHLESISGSPLKWKMWCKKNGYEDVATMKPAEAIPEIIDDMYEKMSTDIQY